MKNMVGRNPKRNVPMPEVALSDAAPKINPQITELIKLHKPAGMENMKAMIPRIMGRDDFSFLTMTT